MMRAAFTLSVSSLLAMGALSPPVSADTLLIPVLTVYSPNIVSIVSVNNRPGNASSHLALTYRYKDALQSDAASNTAGTCEAARRVLPTADGDLVSFDVSGTLGKGEALFGDTNTYGASFAIADTAVTTPTRGYLLVSNADSKGTRADVGHNRDLGGEFVNLDLGAGAAWGGKAINDKNREDYGFISAADGGGVYAALPSNDFMDRRFTFFPPSEWTTRFYVTPIGSAMDTAQLSAVVKLSEGNFYDRNGVTRAFTAISKTVTCTGALDLQDLVDSSTWTAVEKLGGWSWFQVPSGSAVVYKLEYSSSKTYGGAVNNGFLLSDYGLP